MRQSVEEQFLTPREQESNYGFAVWRARPRMMETCHQHNDVEVNYLLQGSFTYLHGGSLLDVGRGDLALFWASRPHQVVALRDEPYFLGLSIPLGWFLSWHTDETLEALFLKGKMIVSRHPRLVERFSRLMDRWCGDIVDDSADHRKVMLIEMEAWLRRLALDLAEGDATRVVAAAREKHADILSDDGEGLARVEQMARFINEHYREPIRVVDVAESAGLHPNYAVNLFRKRTGSTLVDFIVQQRVAHAQLLLATTDEKVRDIAEEAGFGSSSRFFAVFKRALGMSPSQYRQRIYRPRDMG